MQPSSENQIEKIKHEVASPQKEFTREEIEKHNKEDDCWIVIKGKVYDATSVLDWHPGGKAPIMAHAGKVHLDTTDEFESIHDDYAEHKLSGKTSYPKPVLVQKLTGWLQNVSWAKSPRRRWDTSRDRPKQQPKTKPKRQERIRKPSWIAAVGTLFV